MTTLFAPTPNHDIHVGHVWVAWLNWHHARAAGGEFVVLWDDTTYEFGIAWSSGYSFDRGVREVREQLQWLGMAPDRECRSSDNHAAHVEACERLGIRLPQLIGLEPYHLHKPVGVQTPETSALHHRMPYCPGLTVCYVVDDHIAGAQEYYTGDDFLDERLLYEHIAFRLGWVPPRREYVRTITRGASRGKESKTDGAYTIPQLRDAGYEPWQIISTLRECERRSRLAGLAHIVVPYGYLTPERVRWLRYRGDVLAMQQTIAGYELAAAQGDPRFVHSIDDIRQRCELEISRDLQRQRELLG